MARGKKGTGPYSRVNKKKCVGHYTRRGKQVKCPIRKIGPRRAPGTAPGYHRRKHGKTSHKRGGMEENTYENYMANLAKGPVKHLRFH
jgi:hypothetical protein